MAKMPPGCAPELAAISGLPAITLPCGVSRIGLPVGMEMLSAQEDETMLMTLALACEGHCAVNEDIKTRRACTMRALMRSQEGLSQHSMTAGAYRSGHQTRTFFRVYGEEDLLTHVDIQLFMGHHDQLLIVDTHPDLLSFPGHFYQHDFRWHP